MTDKNKNIASISYDHFAVKDRSKSTSAKTVYQKVEYGIALEYAREKLIEFKEETKIDLKLIFKHEEMEFDRDGSILYGQDIIRKSWDFLDELNVNLKEVLKS